MDMFVFFNPTFLGEEDIRFVGIKDMDNLVLVRLEAVDVPGKNFDRVIWRWAAAGSSGAAGAPGLGEASGCQRGHVPVLTGAPGGTGREGGRRDLGGGGNSRLAVAQHGGPTERGFGSTNVLRRLRLKILVVAAVMANPILNFNALEAMGAGVHVGGIAIGLSTILHVCAKEARGMKTCIVTNRAKVKAVGP